jgi:hypothetical protein
MPNYVIQGDKIVVLHTDGLEYVVEGCDAAIAYFGEEGCTCRLIFAPEVERIQVGNVKECPVHGDEAEN